jgi:hypothetical protein
MIVRRSQVQVTCGFVDVFGRVPDPCRAATGWVPPKLYFSNSAVSLISPPLIFSLRCQAL